MYRERVLSTVFVPRGTLAVVDGIGTVAEMRHPRWTALSPDLTMCR